jgi:4-hydroxy-L-threonine phosphate dehydrogenase PdxA
MLTSGELRISHTTTHVSLLIALTRYVTPERVLKVIRLADGAAKQFGIPEPVIGVAALVVGGAE